MTEQMIVENVFSPFSDRNKGAVTMRNPMSDLHQAQAQAGNFLAPNPLGMSKLRMGGSVGQLTRDPGLKRTESFDVMSQMTPPLFSNERTFNTPHPVTRLSKPLAPDIPSVSRDELVFYRQDDARNNKVTRGVDGMMLQYNPLSIVNPAQWNLLTIGEQQAMFRKSPTDYYAMTPKEIFFPWRLDGIVEQNGAGVDSSQFTKSTRTNQPLCILTKGHSTVISYWPYAEPGDDLYVLIKKMRPAPNFILNTKQNGSSSGAGNRIMNTEELGFIPYQMGFWCQRRGGVLDQRVLEYQDDWGNTRGDTHTICIGTVCSSPYGAATFDQAHRIHDNNDDFSSHAYVDSNEGISRNNYTPLKLILNHNNGIYPV